ncbi:MAG: glycosyltransferase family 2 protein [Alphaproteobacteria bacterium]
MTGPRLSALIVAHNEEAELPACLGSVSFADEIVVVLDRCTDGSRSAVERFPAKIVEGAWEIEGPRRMAGIEACSGDWIFEIDADERVSAELAAEIRERIATAPAGYFLVPVDNYIGDRLVRHGWGASWGTAAKACLFSRGAKRWGDQRVHPRIDMSGERQWLSKPIAHYVDRDISDMIARLDRYTSARAKDLRASGEIGSFGPNLRRLFSRFYKCYVRRKGYREGGYGFLIALFAGLYPLLSFLKAKLERE